MKDTQSDVKETNVTKRKSTTNTKAESTGESKPVTPKTAAAKSTTAKTSPAKSTATKAASTKSASAKTVAMDVTASQPVAAKKPAKSKDKGIVTKLVFDLQTMVETEAYLLAERRGFAPGKELDDWLEAEQAVLNRLGQSGTQGIIKQ